MVIQIANFKLGKEENNKILNKETQLDDWEYSTNVTMDTTKKNGHHGDIQHP